MHEMLQHPYYDAMQRMLDDVEMEMMEYLQMKQYHKYLIYHKITTRSQRINESTSTSSRKLSTTTAECYSKS
eukprot:64606-Amphidinium_carterae.1